MVMQVRPSLAWSRAACTTYIPELYEEVIPTNHTFKVNSSFINLQQMMPTIHEESCWYTLCSVHLPKNSLCSLSLHRWYTLAHNCNFVICNFLYSSWQKQLHCVVQ
jgi:hypothetical protein